MPSAITNPISNQRSVDPQSSIDNSSIGNRQSAIANRGDASAEDPFQLPPETREEALDRAMELLLHVALVNRAKA
jgi:hypothetical protein